MRFPDECVRHKIVDMIGDLALAGCDLAGRFIAYRSGHRLNGELVRAIAAPRPRRNPDARNDLHDLGRKSTVHCRNAEGASTNA